jgi:very-short-patch-repair endonuclease
MASKRLGGLIGSNVGASFGWYRRQMRSAMTLSEQKLWSAIAGMRLGGTFRRQVPL